MTMPRWESHQIMLVTCVYNAHLSLQAWLVCILVTSLADVLKVHSHAMQQMQLKAMSRSVLLPVALPCYALPCYNVPCPATPALLHSALPYHTLPCPALLHTALLRPALPCPATPCPAVPCPALPCCTLPCPGPRTICSCHVAAAISYAVG